MIYTVSHYSYPTATMYAFDEETGDTQWTFGDDCGTFFTHQYSSTGWLSWQPMRRCGIWCKRRRR